MHGAVIFLATALLAMCTAPPAAHAASFDCAKAKSEIEQVICRDGELSRADEEMAAAFAAVLDASLMPQDVRGDQMGWLSKRSPTLPVERLLQLYRERIAELRKRADDEQRAREGMSRQDAERRCVEIPSLTPGLECRVEKFGAVKGGRRFRLSYQMQSYWQDGHRVTNGAAVFREQKGVLIPIAAAFEDPGAQYEEPELIESRLARWLLIRGTNDGTEHVNISSLFIYDGRRIRDVDAQSWFGDLAQKLPGDLGMRRGIFPNYRRMTAEAMLMHPEDSCCERASIATIRLGLAGRRIVLRGFRVQPYKPTR